MSDFLTSLWRGYVTTPVAEAFRERGLFRLLDLTDSSDDGLLPLYAVEPEDLIAQEPYARLLREKIEEVCLPLQHPAGAVVVPLAVAFQGKDAQGLAEALDRLEPGLAQAIRALFVQQGWLTPDLSELTESGRALLARDAFELAATYRPLLHEKAVNASTVVTVAASVGLFKDGDEWTKRDYVVRHAIENDLDRLWELEELCWQHTRTSRQRIRARLQRYPQGHFVVEKDGTVLGVIYSQRIAGTDALFTRTAATVDELLDTTGAIIQLLALNVDPRAQNLNYGDQLLEFMLQRCTLVPGVTNVVGVTLCKSYDAGRGESFDDYIRHEGAQQDPVLAFHASHGAEIVRAVPGYRAEDFANLHNGVLVSYDLATRNARKSRAATAAAASLDRRQVQESLRTEAARMLGIDASDVDIDRPVMEMGLDSADLLKLQRHCETAFGIDLEAGFFFEYSTLAKVIEYLAPVTKSMEVVPASEVHVQQRGGANDIAVIGMSCKLPGGIDTPDQLWEVLATDRCVIGSFPQARWNWPSSADYPGIDQGGFVADADKFDAAFFRISPAEAQITDPQQRMLLELSWACLEDAGILPAALKGSNTGVFVGASNCDYSRIVQETGLEIEGHHGVGSSLAILANRISYFFDLSGPSLVVDTACSSSLVAVHTAIRSLRAGECASALVGGVNLISHPDLSIAYHKAGMLSPDGRCKVFDATADGYVRSEGAVVLLLKPLHAAIADGNAIHAVIRGSAINHGGLAGGLTVPNPQKQSELLQAAWKDAGIGANQLTYIEAHGTGTSLGDPIEVQGILHAASTQSGSSRCAIGSVKSNLGHLESAAGITGLLKIILSFKHQQLPASVNFTRLNPKIRLADTPFSIQVRLAEWIAEQARLAGVSSFGSGGANAHVVVQEFPKQISNRRADAESLFVLSAATTDALRAYATRVIDWLERDGSGANFADAIYTWQTGRSAMGHRLAIKTSDRADLLSKLQQWLTTSGEVADVFSGQGTQNDPTLRVWETKSGRQLLEQALTARDLDVLGALWVSGTEIDWRRLWTGTRAEVVSVPTYPFARERYWIETAPRVRSIASSALHPLLHVNSSDLSRQKYTATFSGEEFFLADHQVRVDGHAVDKVLPGVAYLEMARAAVEHANPAKQEAAILELRNTVWVQPIVVDGTKDVHVALAANDDEIDFEIYSDDVVHCQGRAVMSGQTAPARVDLEQLALQMTEQVEASELYAAFARMGLSYGPAFQSINAIQRGNDQVVAYLRLPESAKRSDFVLHPSLMDGALQAAVYLIAGADATQPPLPFALESLRVIAPCTGDMAAWVRSSAAGKLVKLDIDLCDARGNVCVEMRGFSSRVATPHREPAQRLAAPVWQPARPEHRVELEELERHIVVCELASVDIETLSAAFPLSHCLFLEAETQNDVAQRYIEYAVAAFERIQEILQSITGNVLVQIVVPGDAEQSLFAGLSGLLKSAALENPRFAGQLVVVPAETTAEMLVRYLEDERSTSDPQVRYVRGEREVLRWQEVAAEREATPFQDDGVYLITGGTGALGTIFAREILAQTRNARVVLTGRSELTAEKRAIVDDRVSYRRVDLEDLDQVTRLIASIEADYGRLDGILHSAGMIADDFLLRKTTAQFRDVLAPKVIGTFHLDHASRNANLDLFILFSSVVAVTGNVGQADYAAANGFLDQFAAWRNELVARGQRHGRTRSINWPLWQAGGMGLDAASEERLRQTTGMRPMQTAAGLEAFRRSVELPHSQTLIVAGDLTRLLADAPKPSVAPAEPVVVAARIDAQSLTQKTEEYLRRQLAEVVKLPSQKIDPQAALEEYGIDSILAMKLTTHLEQTFGSLAKTLFFEYRTLRELTGYFVAEHASQLNALLAPAASDAKPVEVQVLPPARTASLPSRRAAKSRSVATNPAPESEPIAIVGLSGRYPEAFDLDAYWRNLRDGKDCVIEVPKERWDWKEHFTEDRTQTGRHYSKWGGFIEGVDEFDPLFFNIAPKEANYLDPQERLFLQHAWMAVEDAGYTRATLQVPSEGDLPGQVGVYVGVMWSEYQTVSAESRIEDLRMGFAGNLASIANRVSYALNLHGPSMTLDTMCSSSLTAIHVACQDLQLRRTSMAIAGGVNVSIHPNKYLLLSVGQFISSDGHCQSFGEGGDGYIPGEGVGAVVLKRLSDAERDGDHIYGIIRGSALTHGGRTNGYTVPNPQAQTSAISRALAEARIDARHISYIEAHGTGTKLGDPIEIAALSKAFRQQTDEAGFCLIGSAKSNIGHCESAAGIAGLTKVLLQMQHREIVPSLHSAQLNPHIDFAKTPFVVNQTLRPWEQPVIDGRTLPRIAGISSFGAGGSNAHMIIEEYPAAVREPRRSGNAVIVLSARTAEQLRQKAQDLLSFVSARTSSIDLRAMAYTLQVGREAMEERLGFVVGSTEQLIEKLRAYVAGERDIEDAWFGQVKRNKEALAVFTSDPDLQKTVDSWIANGKTARLVDLWVKGLELDWTRLHGNDRPQRVSLPTYPFARERYWIERAVSKQTAAPKAAVLHPLLHSNASDLNEQRYRSTFTGEESFVVGKALPIAASFEMTRAAIEHAMPRPAEAKFLELRDVVVADPIIVEGGRDVSIALWPETHDEIEYELYTEDGDVHAQGRAVFGTQPAPAKLDLAQLERNGESLVRLQLRDDAADYVLHPSVLDSIADGRSLRAIRTLRIVSPCTSEMVAWVRSASGELDIDVCDASGNVAVQMHGTSWSRTSSASAPQPIVVVETPAPVAPPVKVTERREIVLAVPAAVPAERKTRSAISLTAPGAVIAPRGSAGKPVVALSTFAASAPAQDAGNNAVRLYDSGNGIYAIEIASGANSEHVLHALRSIQNETLVKVVTLRGIERCVVNDGLLDAIASFPLPLIAVLHGDTIGTTFLAAALCDFMVGDEDALLGATGTLSAFEATLICERFGDVAGRAFLSASAPKSGRELRAKGWTSPFVPRASVDATAQQLAESLSTKSRTALRLLKQHLSRNLAGLSRIETVAPAIEVASVSPITSPADFIELETVADHVLVVRFRAAGAEDVIAGLGHVLFKVRQAPQYKAIVLAGETPDAIPEGLVLEAQRLLVESEIPVIAALTANARGNAWLLAESCDACVYSREGVYSAAGITPAAATMFRHRLGDTAAAEILLTGGEYSGRDLEQRVGGLIATEHDRVLSTAIETATSWANVPRATVREWKRRATAIDAIRTEPTNEIAETLPAVPTPIALRTSVVTATAHPEGIVVVKLEDREAKNMFSDAFIQGVHEVFAHIAKTPAYKVVVLTGYDTYFSSGGTPESLLAIQQGKAKFTDYDVYQAALDCRLPVIAAMQGHGIGAGWSLGMFADIVLLSEESRYVSPYMGYGFTPGAGATWVLPRKIGVDVARESLLSAQPMTGRELKARSATLRVLPRAEVVPAAMALARRIAATPRQQLIAVKQQLNAGVREPLEETYRLELEMHDKTFVGQSDTLARLQESFEQAAETPRVERVEVATPAGEADNLRAVTSTLKALLANELQVRENEIDETTQFVDLGLDSISGVTWIRKINEKYRTAIEATKVYSYPTLAELSRYVAAEAAKTRPAAPVQPALPAPQAVAAKPATSNGRGVADTLRQLLANELQVRESDIDDTTQFVDLGLDSISGVTWIRKINEKYQTSIEATKVYSYPTLAELSRYVQAEAEARGTLSSPAAPAPEPVPVAHVAPARREESTARAANKLTSRRKRNRGRLAAGPRPQAIAVVGMAGQFPQAKNVDEFWRNIAEGRNCITPVPRERWDVETYYQPGEPVAGRTTSQWAGMIDGYDQFDPLFFSISPTEAESMDPQQRLFLQACWHGIENAGYAARSLSGSKCGVFVGCADGDYHLASREHQLSAQGFTGSAMSILAARISYFLNLQGACVSIDTACSSSLVAIAQACESLISGNSDLALAGGVYVMTGPEMHIKTSQAGMLSPDGKCYTFDQRANGFVPGEAVGVVVLKRLEDARRDNDIIHAVIQGWGVNQDGKTNGITAPNPESQARLEREVYEKFAIDPATIELIEAHGTGTKLGDPIEVEGLKSAFRGATRDNAYCAIGSVKSNIGHCLAAAGIAGVLKLVQALKHRQLPPTIHFERLNEHIDLTGSPFYVNTSLRPWEPRAQKRLAAISSFGFSGTNAHLVIGDYAASTEVARPATVVTQNGSVIVPLSARTAEQLREKARELAQFLREQPTVDLVQLAYTLQVGREPMDERLGVVAGSIAQLADRLESFVAGESKIEGVFRGQIRQVKDSTSILSQDDDVKQAIVDKWVAERKLSKLLELWVNGLELDWSRFYGEVRPQRIALPVYPFAKDRYWITPDAPAQIVVADAASVLHPLLHRNTSDLSEQRYSSRFTGEEFFLADHQVRTGGHNVQKVLPGVAYLEMARAAISQTWPMQVESNVVELRDTTWLKPVIANEPQEVSITLFATEDDRIEYEIYGETVHCQGHAVFHRKEAAARLDLESIRRRMSAGRLDAARVYEIFASMGLHYGPAHRGITALELGNGELLAQLRLPAGVEAGRRAFVLHPSLMDSALQATIGLLVDGNRVPDAPLVPFLVESVRVLSPCTTEMTAWVRRRGGQTAEFDIDLCDSQGTVCVEIRGFVTRSLQNTKSDQYQSFDQAFYDRLIADVLNNDISVDEAVELM